MSYHDINNYKSGEKPQRGDRVEAPSTKKDGPVRRGRVTGMYATLRGRTDVSGVLIRWEHDSRAPASPRESRLDAAVLTRIDERDYVAGATSLEHDLASRIAGLPYAFYQGIDMYEPVRLENGKIVDARTLVMAKTAVKFLNGMRSVELREE